MVNKKKRFRLKTAPPEYISTSQAAEILGVTIVSVRRYIKEAGLPAVRPAGRYLIPLKEFNEWVKQNNAYENTEADS